MVKGVRKIQGKIIGFYQLDVSLNDTLRRWASMKGLTKASATELLIGSYYELMTKELLLAAKRRDAKIASLRPAISIEADASVDVKHAQMKKLIEQVKPDIFAGGFVTEKDLFEEDNDGN